MFFDNYLDKVYGCWIGKCIGGNIGAPFEGMKQKLSVKFNSEMVEKMLPNDDLDLQILFLDVVEKYGANFSSEHLAKSFSENCPYAPGEYAYFKKNYRSGIHPPLCGTYNNRVYHNGMGCTIRSEIWACLAPGKPDVAVEYCLREGILDHYGDGLYGEVFCAALESYAFVENDIQKLINKAISYIPGDCILAKLIKDTVNWALSDLSYMQIRDKIVQKYGSAEATSVYQNVGFIILGLLRGADSFLQAVIDVCNCGFDTDCTCATFGAIKGIICGGNALNREYSYKNLTYKLGVTAKDRSGLVTDLSREVAELGAILNDIKIISPIFEFDLSNFKKSDDILFEIEYLDGVPAISFDSVKRVVLHIKNNTDVYKTLTFKPNYPLVIDVYEVQVSPNESTDVELSVRVSPKADRLPKSNLIAVRYEEGEYIFGFNGMDRYEVFGPFWENNVEVPELKGGESYWSYFPSDTLSAQMDAIRFYHTNCLAKDITVNEAVQTENLLDVINVPEDIVTIEDYFKFDGQAFYFLKFKFCVEQKMRCGIQLGYNTFIEFYLNGNKILSNDIPTRYTPENSHLFFAEIQQGSNEIIVKIKKCSDITHFSFDFLTDGACSDHIIEYLIEK